jgi:uncharacterized membrane protein YebE (DUF533 family)
MSGKLSRDVFVALAAVAWADGQLAEEEAQGIVRAARDAGLDGDDLAAVEEAARSAQSLDAINLSGLSRADKMFVYATAVWLSRLDGVVETGERATLWKLGDKLGLPDGIRTDASAAAFRVAQLPTGDRPEKFDFVALRERIAERIQQG